MPPSGWRPTVPPAYAVQNKPCLNPSPADQRTRLYPSADWSDHASLKRHVQFIAHHPLLSDSVVFETQQGYRDPLDGPASDVDPPHTSWKARTWFENHVMRQMDRYKVALAMKVMNVGAHRPPCGTRRRLVGTHDEIAGRKMANCAWEEQLIRDLLTAAIQHLLDESPRDELVRFDSRVHSNFCTSARPMPGNGF